MRHTLLLPKASVTLTCAECGQVLGEVTLNQNGFVEVLYRLRKHHARIAHNWTEEVIHAGIGTPDPE